MTRFLPILLALPLAAVSADTLKLKSGEILQGRVIDSDANSVTFEAQFSPTIVDQQTYSRSDIADLSMESKDEIAFAKIRDVKTPATALGPKACQVIIDTQLTPFLQQYPSSSHAAEVQKLLKSIQADLARLKAGDVKVSGIWYDRSSFDNEKYQIEAATALEAMKQEADEKNFPAAMNSYDLLQRSYQNSMAYVDAVPLAVKVAASLEAQLNFALRNMPQTLAQRQASVDRTPVEQQAPIKRAIAAEDARAAASALIAQKNSQRFFTIFPFDEQGIKNMLTAMQQTDTDLRAVDQKKLESAAHLVRQANAELDKHQLAAAETTLGELRAAWPEYEGLNRMDQRLQAAKNADANSEKDEKSAGAPQ